MIRPWEVRDAIPLRRLIRKFLESQAAMGGDIAVSDNNISFYLALGYEQIKQGDPHLIFEDSGEIRGYIQLGAMRSCLERVHKTAEYFGVYVIPEFSGNFISIQLLRAAGEQIAKLGYERGVSMMHLPNRRMIQNMFFNPAIWPTQVVCEWRLDCDAQLEDRKVTSLIERQGKS